MEIAATSNIFPRLKITPPKKAIKSERELAHAHVHRLHHRVVESIDTSATHLELISDMKRLNSLFCSPAYAAIEAASAQPGGKRGARAENSASSPAAADSAAT